MVLLPKSASMSKLSRIDHERSPRANVTQHPPKKRLVIKKADIKFDDVKPGAYFCRKHESLHSEKWSIPNINLGILAKSVLDDG